MNSSDDEPTNIRLSRTLLDWAEEVTRRVRKTEPVEIFDKLRRPDIIRLALRIGLDELAKRDLTINDLRLPERRT